MELIWQGLVKAFEMLVTLDPEVMEGRVADPEKYRVSPLDKRFNRRFAGDYPGPGPVSGAELFGKPV